MPKGVVNVFLKTYVGLKKHLSYRGWVSKQHSTCANGVAQGCSLSLLAINTFMAVWVKFVSLIPHVTCRVFIDDAYLWVRIQHLHHLQTAFHVTQQWNLLIGQKLNPDKSTLWATSTSARSQAKTCFPAIPLALEFDALGAKIYTSQRNATACSPERIAKIRTDIRNISALSLFLGKPKANSLLLKLSRSVHLPLSSQISPRKRLPICKLTLSLPYGRTTHIGARKC